MGRSALETTAMFGSFGESSAHLLQLWCRCLGSSGAQRKRWLPWTCSGPSWAGAHCRGEGSHSQSDRRGKSFPAESGPRSPRKPYGRQKANVLEDKEAVILAWYNIIVNAKVQKRYRNCKCSGVCSALTIIAACCQFQHVFILSQEWEE